MLTSNATGFLTSLTVAVLAVMTAVGWRGVAEAGRITPGQITHLRYWRRCPPNGTTVDKARVNETWNEGRTLLHLAAVTWCTDLARVLLQLHADKLAGDDWGMIPLHYAVFAGAEGVVALLLADGDADRQRLARTATPTYIPLHFAVFRPAVARRLMANCTNSHLHAQLAARDKHGRTLLSYVISKGRNADLNVIADEIVGRDGCPSNPAFISRMLRGQTREAIQRTKRVIADISKTRCTNN